MLFGADEQPGVRTGEITLVHRRWRARLVYAGRTYRTNLGRIVVDDVTELDASHITDADAVRAGKHDADEVRAQLRGQPEWPVFRIEFHLADDPDPRAELAAKADLDEDELADLRYRLSRLDRVSSHGAWTRTTLQVIAAKPATRAADLAAHLGRETAPFKPAPPQPRTCRLRPAAHIRKLKKLGLTYSLEVGYRLAPRGETYLRWLS